MFPEIRARTHHSFLRGASSPAELIQQAAALGLSAIGIMDRNGVYGVPRAYDALQSLPEGAHRPKLLIGAELVLSGGLPPLGLLARTRKGYGNLCRILTRAHAGKEKGKGELSLRELTHECDATDLFALPAVEGITDEVLAELREKFSRDSLFLPLARELDGMDRERTAELRRLAARSGLGLVATQYAHFHARGRKPLQDVLTAIRENTPVEALGYRLFSNAERTLFPPQRMAEMFRDVPEALARAQWIAHECRFDLSQLRYRYPSEWIPSGETAQSYLAALTWKGACERYRVHEPSLVPADARKQIVYELKLIHELKFADYFLTVWDIVDFAQRRRILCQGRGSAANSIVCYCLKITAIDPTRASLLFERFISAERGEPPDIDVDFEHERREEVIQYIYEKYGRDRAAMVAAVITYHSKSILRDIGKALHWTPEQVEASPLYEELRGFPRHLSIHSGGFTLSADPIIETVPVEPARMEGRTVVQWDKEDLAIVGLLKVDVLSIGMLTAMRKTFDLVNGGPCDPNAAMAAVPPLDEPTFEMIRRADTVGVFQIESRAQMNMLGRLEPRDFYDLVVEVAIVRPGPIVGQMVHPYLRRRRGLERIDIPHPKLEPILRRTLGVPLFQEQIMKMAVALAGFTPGDADRLRRAIGAWRSSGQVDKYGRMLREGLLREGLPAEFVERVFKQVLGFSEYGFPESHAASYALLAYVSSYQKCHFPAAFACSLMNSQPMGFYSNHTILEDARRHGVGVRPLSFQRSAWDATLEDGEIRVGFRMLKGANEAAFRRFAEARARGGPFRSAHELLARGGFSAATWLECAQADAFQEFGLERRAALWEILAHLRLRREASAPTAQLSLFDGRATELQGEGTPTFTRLSGYDAIQADYASLGLSTKGHPMEPLRRLALARPDKRLRQFFVRASCDWRKLPHGTQVRTAGLVITRQRPPTAKGVGFATLEDEMGFLDVIVKPDVQARYEEAFRSAGFWQIEGRLERDRATVQVMVHRLWELDVASLTECGEKLRPRRRVDFR